jgi:hypothetical protein
MRIRIFLMRDVFWCGASVRQPPPMNDLIEGLFDTAPQQWEMIKIEAPVHVLSFKKEYGQQHRSPWPVLTLVMTPQPSMSQDPWQAALVDMSSIHEGGRYFVVSFLYNYWSVKLKFRARRNIQNRKSASTAANGPSTKITGWHKASDSFRCRRTGNNCE